MTRIAGYIGLSMDPGERLTDDELAQIAEVLASISPAAALGFRDESPGDHVETLLDLARAGDEATFKELARSLGVAPARLDALWAGTVARL